MGSVVNKVTGALGLDSVLGEGQAASTGVNSFGTTSGVGTADFNAATGQSTSTMSPELQRLFDQGLSQAGAFGSQVMDAGAQAKDMSAGFLSEAGAFDPFAAAEDQFNRLDAILEPGRTKSRTGTAAGLLSTGRLGSTSGNDLQAQIEAQIEQQRQGLLGEQFTAAQGVQDSMISRGVTLGSYGQQEQAGAQALGHGALSSALGIDSQLQALLGMGSNMTKTAPIAGVQSGTQQLMQGALSGGIGALTSLI